MKEKKTIIILILVLVVGVVGLTIAYFSNSTTLNNEFITKEYGTTYTEEFVSPDNWLPGTTTAKTIIAENTGEVDEAVRLSISESWTTHNNGTLNGWIHSDGTKSTHTTELELANDERVAVLNLANTSDWTKVGNYYYYNYKLAPGEETTSFLESVTFNAKTKLDDTCVTTTSGSTKTITCDSSGDDYDDATYILTITVETVQYNKYNEAWNLNNSVTIASMKPMNARQLALKSNPVSVTNYTDGNVHEMYTFNHEATEQTPALTDYRYIGNDPYNYVYFNCDNLNNQNSETCEVWRIIGVFDVERPDPNDNTQTITERRMKLVRGSALSETMAWDSNGVTDWTNSSIKIFLNGDYNNNSGIAQDYGLKQTSSNMIENALFYLGGNNSVTSAEDAYKWERGNKLCYSCNNDNSKLKWNGKIALMYSSDMYMTYGNQVDNNCFIYPSECGAEWAEHKGISTLSWLYNSNIVNGTVPSNTWFLSPNLSNGAFSVYSGGYLISYYNTGSSRGIRPTLYLSSSVQIIDGDGSINNPYWLSNS